MRPMQEPAAASTEATNAFRRICRVCIQKRHSIPRSNHGLPASILKPPTSSRRVLWCYSMTGRRRPRGDNIQQSSPLIQSNQCPSALPNHWVGRPQPGDNVY